MRRVAPKVPISPAMLRHFAAITVVATVCLALFANGENKQAEAAVKSVAGPAGEAALKTPRVGGRKEVNGLVIGHGTRLENNASDPDEAGGGGGGGGMGHINNYYGLPPGSVTAVPGPAGVRAARPGVPPPVLRDANGIPLPPGIRLRGSPPPASKDQPPPPATEADINRMLELSRARTGRLDPDEVIE